MSDPRYRVSCQSGRFANKWVAWRVADGGIMTEGSVKDCLRWVDVWGPMLHDKHVRMYVPQAWMLEISTKLLDRPENPGKIISMSTSEITPTDEQQAAIDAFKTGENMVLEAGAGAGKTTTLKLLGLIARESGKRGLYLSFNKAIADEAKRSFPDNVDCRTAHSLAYKPVMFQRGVNYQRRMKMKKLSAEQLAVTLGSTKSFKVGPEDELNRRSLAYLAMTTVDRFCRSDADQIEFYHTPKIPEATEAQQLQIRAEVHRLALKAWALIIDPQGDFPWAKKGFGYYLKMFQLQKPVLNYDFILFDEAQDANPVMAAIVMSQSHIQKVLVGDRNQAIYGWNGAVDAMSNFDVKYRLPITQSFRFGQPIAAEGNKFLTALNANINGEAFRIRGFDKVESTVETLETPQAILCRTNGGVLENAMAYLEQGKKVAISRNLANDLKGFGFAALALMKGEPTEHPELGVFANWQEVVEFAGTDEGKDIAMLVKLIQAHGPCKLIEVANASEQDESNADVALYTAHTAKGREWDTVRISGDFIPTPNKETGEINITEADLMLAYVAVTRAKKTLDNLGLAWIDNFLADRGLAE